MFPTPTAKIVPSIGGSRTALAAGIVGTPTLL